MGKRQVSLDVLRGFVIAAITWWALDVAAGELYERLALGLGATLQSAWFLLIGALGTLLLVSAFRSLLVAGGLLLLGVIWGMFIDVPGGNLGLSVLRGAHEPAVFVLSGAWLALGARGVLARRFPR